MLKLVIILLSIVVVRVAYLGYVYTSPPPPFHPPPGPLTSLSTKEKLALVDERLITHVTVDKLIYRPGDVLHFRAVLLNVLDSSPLKYNENSTIKVTGPSGNAVFAAKLKWNETDYTHSTIGSNWLIPSSTPGGEYVIEVSHDAPTYLSGERKFQIREYIIPRITGGIEFDSKSYGSGDRVLALLQAERAEGGAPDKAQVTFTAIIGGKTIHEQQTTLDSTGKASTQFEIGSLSSDQGVLVAKIVDGGVVETISKTIPLTSQISIEFYPEGGELAIGATNVVYFQASLSNGDPADIEATLCLMEEETSEESDDEFKCTPVGTVVSYHEGRGKFELFKALPNQMFTLKVIKPTTIQNHFSIHQQSVFSTVTVPKSVVKQGDSLDVVVWRPYASIGALNITLARIERELLTLPVNFQQGEQNTAVTFQIPKGAPAGVYRVTLQSEHRPVAERLIMIKHSSEIKFEVSRAGENISATVPGETVKLEITTTDSNGYPIPAIFGITVVDKSVSRKIDQRKKFPRLRDMVLLENEVISFDDASSYLKDDKKLDLLLGVQGWRRFVETDVPGNAYKALGVTPTILTAQYYDETSWLAEMLRHVSNARHYLYTNVVAHLRKRYGEDKGTRLSAVSKDDFYETDYIIDSPLYTTTSSFIPPGTPVAQQFDSELLIRRKVSKQDSNFSYKRVYAHQSWNDPSNEERSDFEEVVFFATSLPTDSQGMATVEFDLSDSITTFEILIDGFQALSRGVTTRLIPWHRNRGSTSSFGWDNPQIAFGEFTAEFNSLKQFYVETKLPIEISEGDVIEIPVTLFNAKPNPVSASFTVHLPRDSLSFVEGYVNDTMT